jgi:hypothetical protein
MNVIVFGPPGIGKSTILERAENVIGGDYAVDLEREEPRKLLQLMGWNWMFCSGRLANCSIIGGADLDPRVDYPNTRRVILTLPEAEYRARRRARDARIPSKKLQPAQSVAQWTGIDGAYYVEADEYALDKILALRS